MSGTFDLLNMLFEDGDRRNLNSTAVNLYSKFIAESLEQPKRDEDWAYLLNKDTRALHLAFIFEFLSEDAVNSRVLPLLQRARNELVKCSGENIGHYLYCLDVRIESSRNYIEGKLPPMTKYSTPEEVNLHDRLEKLI